MNAVESDSYEPLSPEATGKITVLGEEADAAYMERLNLLILDRPRVASARDLRIVFSSIHGVAAG